MTVDDALLRSHWQFMKNATANDLYAGLSALAMQLNHHFGSLASGEKSIEQFQSLYSTVVPNSKRESAGVKTIKEEQFEFKPDLLFDKKEEDFATRMVEGEKIFLQFAAAYKPTICSTKGVLGILLRGTVNTEELPVIIASHLLKSNLSEAGYWYLFAMMLGCLIDKQTVEKFCEES